MILKHILDKFVRSIVSPTIGPMLALLLISSPTLKMYMP